MSHIYPIPEQAQACLAELDPNAPAFSGIDMQSQSAVAGRIREYMNTVELRAGDALNCRISQPCKDGKPVTTPHDFITRCLENYWTVVGHTYKIDPLDYNISPSPSENSKGRKYGEWTYQFNRHAAWVVAALHYHRTNHERAVDALAHWIRVWVETCPSPERYPLTAETSWRTIEIGIRLGSNWPQVFTAIKDSPELDDALLLAWLNSVYQQCEYVSANRKEGNWLMIEVNGLMVAALMFPFFKNAKKWEADALGVFEAQIDDQFMADGMQYSLSASYHGVSFSQYMRINALMERFGQEPPEQFIPAMKKMLGAWRAAVRPNGQVFCFQDSTRVDYRDWLERPTMPSAIKVPADDDFFTGSGPAPKYRNNLLPDTGYCVLRSGWSGRDTAVAVDVGPIGANHQHEDKLSIQIWSRGKDILGEAGLVDYADSPQRTYSLGTRAHSTAVVDGQMQNRKPLYNEGKLKFNRSQVVEATYDLESARPWVRAAYKDGYGPENEIEVEHEREVVLEDRDHITITDRFDAKDGKPHIIEVLFHLLVAGEYRIDGACSRTIGNQPDLVMHYSRSDGGPLDISGVKGGPGPDLRGWASMDPADFTGTYELVPRPCITVLAEMVATIEIVTRIEIVD